ncbi:MAG: hypothetical protein Kow0099_01990 [Candidatus Abyssubacteria bacterium]
MKRILVIHRGSLGDFLLLLPALVALRKKFPHSHIELLGRTEILSLVCPGVADAISSAERATLVGLFEHSGELPEREVAFFSSFDAVVAYVSDTGGIFARNLERMGIENRLVCPPFPPEGRRIHVGRYLAESILPILGGPLPPVVGFPFHFTREEIRRAESLLECVRRSARPILAVHPGSGSRKKCWPAERFDRLVDFLRMEVGVEIVMMLGPADERLAGGFRSLASQHGFLVLERLSLRSLAAVLSLCDAYVGNDSGATHLAARVGIPTIAIFGPTDPAVWAPAGPNVQVLAGTAGCAPCTRETMGRCERQLCLEAVTVEQVVHAIRDTIVR